MAAGGGAYVNNQFGVNPPSFGVATLEGIRANGLAYNNFTAYGYSDTLTSKPLNLKNYNPVRDSLYLSFFWQAGGLAGSPDTDTPARPVFLALEFKEPSGTWREVWRQVGENKFTAFARVDVPITDPLFLYKGFQFRFRNSGEQKGTGDAWNLDYIYLNKKINPAKTLLEDVAISTSLNSLLNRYTAMPAWQFLANADAELNDSLFTTINNQNNRFAPITWRGYNQILNVAQPIDTFLRGNAAIEPLAAQYQVLGKPELSSSTALGNDFSVKSSIFLNSRETFAPTRQNDTISRLTEFKDYFAYDDGTAETNFSLDKTGQRQGAYSFDLNVPDFVKGIRVYLTKTNVPSHLITFRVWDAGEQGNPASTAKAQQGFVIPKVDTLNRFYDILFPTPVPVQGTFFIGWSLSNTIPDFVNIGFDLNEDAPGKIKYNNGTGGWTTFTGQRGALLMRPLMARVTGNKNIIADQSAVNAFPNPSTGKVNLVGDVLNWVVTDVTGKVYLKGAGNRTNRNEVNLSFVSNGLYFIHCYTKKGIIIKKISINH
ncbi:T9SS type A sorting domain-containing protein [Adhaeribacter swui]|uniref:T9SS type A sorting domain-containing protein n=1 Tax=Adhaeribacter swui TaxID=2086471 RepID=A0A7G7GEA2_9BACT|nr:T9SS type A sorting domain-containing protein [Adhaeribacter swui]QNF35486.1 T9SS type A sorting domain-containing protein [Adhaeribacter swui]